MENRSASDSRQQPAWHVAVLGLFLPAIYIVYWAYKTWRDLKEEAQEKLPADQLAKPAADETVERTNPLSLFANVNPTLRAVALLLPLLDVPITMAANIDPFFGAIGGFFPFIAMALYIYLLGVLLIGICSLVPNAESFPRKHPLFACAAVMMGYLFLLSTIRLPAPWWLMGLLSAIPFAFAQHWLNQYWRSAEPADVTVRNEFNGVEIVIIVFGGALLGLLVTGTMLGIRPH